MAAGLRQSRRGSAVLAAGVLGVAVAGSLSGVLPPRDADLAALAAALSTVDGPILVVAWGADELGPLLAQRTDVRYALPYEEVGADAQTNHVLTRSSSPTRLAAGVVLGDATDLDGWTLFAPSVAPSDTPEVDESSGPIELIDRLPQARAYIEAADGTRRDCATWAFGRIHCGPDDWNWIGPTTLTVRGRSETCIWAHPTDEGTIVLEFDDLPARGVLRGRVGLSDEAAASDNDTPVSFVVHRDGDEILTRSHRIRPGFSSFRERIERDESRETMTLAFRISAEFVGQRHFCFSATLDVGDVPATREPEAEGSASAEGSEATRPGRGIRRPNRLREGSE